MENCFDYGQVYVALSRCRKLSGLTLKSPILKESIKIDPVVINFAKTKTPHTLIVQELEKGIADKLYNKARIAFENNSFEEMMNVLDEAIKIRDDRDTPIFKKYIKIKSSQYQHNKETKYKQMILVDYLRSQLNETNQEFQDLLKDSQINELYINRIEDSRESLIDENQELKNSIHLKECEIFKLKQSLDIANGKTIGLEKANQELLDHKERVLRTSFIDIENLKTKIRLAEEIITEKNQKLEFATTSEEKLENEISKLKEKLSDTEIELFRAESVSWWRKLFGMES